MEYDLHGIVGIRLVGASERDAAAVRRQLGPLERPLSREPDIVIRFVDRLVRDASLRLLGVRDVAYDDRRFLILRGKHKTPVRVSVPFARVGARCEIVCERGLAAVPLLIAIVNLTALARGALPLHASAFRFGGRGVLVTGWSKGGKTETLLGALARGAEYVGDEWVYLDGDGATMYGIPEPIRVQDWHLEELPAYRARLDAPSRARLRVLRSLSRWLRPGDRRRGRVSAADRLRYRGAALLDRQRSVHLRPAAAFGDGFGPLRSSVDRVILVGNHEAERIAVTRIDPDEVADRMAFSLQEERRPLESYYRKFRFAHPGRVNPILEGAAETERRRLHEALSGKPCFAVHHPSPVSIPALFEAVLPLLADEPHVRRRSAGARRGDGRTSRKRGSA